MTVILIIVQVSIVKMVIFSLFTTGATSGAGPPYPAGSPGLIHGFSGVLVARSVVL